MSDLVNTQLFESAAEMIDYWEGTPIARVIEADLGRNDLEGLAVHVRQARNEMFDLEYQP